MSLRPFDWPKRDHDDASIPAWYRPALYRLLPPSPRVPSPCSSFFLGLAPFFVSPPTPHYTLSALGGSVLHCPVDTHHVGRHPVCTASQGL